MQIAAVLVYCQVPSLAAVRIPSTLLKPAVCLLLGASTVFGCSVANALTFNWSVDTDDPTLTGSGGGTFTTSAPAGNVYTITGATGSWTDSINGTQSITGVSFADNDFTSYIPDNTFSYFGPGDLNVTSRGISLLLANGFAYNLSGFLGDDVYSTINKVVLYDTPSTVSQYAVGVNATNVQLSAVPGPLPILGLPAVLFYSRKLKARIKASRELSSNALV